MSVSVVATPTQEGVTRLPTAAHLRTNVLNGNVRIASQTGSTGAQPATYEIIGGSITNNVKLALPNVNSDDTLVTQNGNITWGGGHTFTQGLNATGPIITSSSITGQSVSATALTVSNTLTSGGSITAGGNLNAQNHVIAGQNLQAGAALTVGTTGFVTGNLTAASSAFQVTSSSMTHTGSLSVQGGGLQTASTAHQVTLQSMVHNPNGLAYGALGHLQLVNANGGTLDSDFYGISAGTTNGLIICTSVTQKFGFNNITPTAQTTGGSKSADSTWTVNNVSMLNIAYTTLRNKGIIS